jgi:hypothetical protein
MAASGISSSIHFRSMAEALTAFEARGVDVWSLWQGRQFLTKGSGREDLQSFLNMIMNSGSSAVYTVKIYEEIDEPKKIKSTTPDDGSFNFRLQEPDAVGGNYTSPLSKRMEKLEEMIVEMREAQIRREAEEEEEYEEKEPDIIGSIMGVLQDPDRLEKLIRVGRSIFGGPVAPAYVGNVNRMGEMSPHAGSPSLSPSTGTPDEKLARLGNAIDVLEKHDPLLVEHLERLAGIAVGDPGKFKQLISMLEIF